jgi:hypothetical protein
VFSLVSRLPSGASADRPSSMFGPFVGVGSEEARRGR